MLNWCGYFLCNFWRKLGYFNTSTSGHTEWEQSSPNECRMNLSNSFLQIFLRVASGSWTTTTCATSGPSSGRRSSPAPTPSTSTTTTSANPNATARPVTSPALVAAGAKELKIVKSSPRSTAVRSVIKEDVSAQSHVNAAISSAPEDAQARSSQTVW